MGIEILDQVTVVVEKDESLFLEVQPDGERRLFRGLRSIADDGDGLMATEARYALKVRDFKPRGCTVAIIGGGLGILPRLLWKDYTITVHEIEPRLDRFTPNWCTFIPGDWRTTISGTYDVIVYDLGGDVPVEELTPHLAPGGIILPAEKP